MGASAAVRLPSAAASTNATSGLVGAVQLCGVFALNASAAVRYLKIYDKATAPTVGTDIPVLTIAMPVGATDIDFANRFMLGKGLAFALTTGATDADTGAVTAADVVGLNITYS